MIVEAPIDEFAFDGRAHCVIAADGTRHSAHFADDAWRYGNGQPVKRKITHYLRREH